MRFYAAVLSLCLALQVPALQVASRLAASRILQAPLSCRQCAPLCMCDAEGEVAEAEPAPAAEPVAEAAPVEAAEEEAKPQRSRKAKIPIEELEVGSTLEGKIRSVQTYGAFVDLGAATDGLLHVSEMSSDFVKDANEMFKAGDTVSVRIKNVNLEKKQVALTCKEEDERPRPQRKSRPDLSEYAEADPKAFITGKVNSIQSYGAFITLKEGVDGLVHISAIQEGGVGSVEEVLEVGQEVQVRIISFDKQKRRIGLSMKPFVEGGDEASGGGGRGERRERRGRGGGDFFEDDTAFQLSEEELSELGFDYEDTSDEASDFASAFARASSIQQAKEEKKKYAKAVL